MIYNTITSTLVGAGSACNIQLAFHASLLLLPMMQIATVLSTFDRGSGYFAVV